MYGPFPPPRLCCRGILSTTSRSDSRSPLPLLTAAGCSRSTSWVGSPSRLTAGGETGLSCSSVNFPTIPRPLRRGVLQGRPPSASPLPWPSPLRARLGSPLLPPCRGGTFRRGRLHFMLRTGGLLTLLPRAFPRASSFGSPFTMAAVLQRWLGPSFGRTSTGELT